MSYRFPYFEDRPHIPITLVGPLRRIRYIPLLDTGADFTTLSRNEAILLGLNWHEGKGVALANADGSGFDAKMFRLILEIEQITLYARVCFVDKMECSMPLLGRRDIFRHFNVMIDESAQIVELKT